MISHANSNDKYHRSNNSKNRRDYYKRRSTSKSRTNKTTSRSAINKDYYHYKQSYNSRSKSRSPNQSNRYRRTKSKSNSPNRYKSKRNHSPYRRPTDSKPIQPQVVSSSIRPNVNDNLSMEDICGNSESSLKLRNETENERKKIEIDAKKITNSVVIKRDDTFESDSVSKKRRHSKEKITKPNDRRPVSSNFPIEDDFAIKIDAANSRTVISRLVKSEPVAVNDKEGSVLSSVSSDSRDNNLNKKTSSAENGSKSKHHKSKKKHKHKNRSPSKLSSSKIQV